jgi:hypothetical protein
MNTSIQILFMHLESINLSTVFQNYNLFPFLGIQLNLLRFNLIIYFSYLFYSKAEPSKVYDYRHLSDSIQMYSRFYQYKLTILDWSVLKVVECFPSRHEALSSSLSTA